MFSYPSVPIPISYNVVVVPAPRRLIPVNANVEVYTANEAPPDQLIPFHHELAQVANPPQYIFFYCDLPSETGGETALIDSTLGMCLCEFRYHYIISLMIFAHDTMDNESYIPVYRYVADHHPEFMEKLKLHGGE